MLHFAGGRSKHFRYLYSFSAQPRAPFWHKNQYCHPKTGPLSQILVTRGHPSFRSLASQEITRWVSDLAIALPHFFSLSSQVSISASWAETQGGKLRGTAGCSGPWERAQKEPRRDEEDFAARGHTAAQKPVPACSSCSCSC